MRAVRFCSKLVAAVWWVIGLSPFVPAQELGSVMPTCGYFAMERTAITFLTPYVASKPRSVTGWKANFTPMLVPAAVQLKVFRQVSPDQVQVVGAGEWHDPRSAVEAMPGYPSVDTDAGIVEFAESNVKMLTGDILGITILPDPSVGAFYYPLVAGHGSRAVQQDLVSGGAMHFRDAASSLLPGQVPAILVTSVVDASLVKPGSHVKGGNRPSPPLAGSPSLDRNLGHRAP